MPFVTTKYLHNLQKAVNLDNFFKKLLILMLQELKEFYLLFLLKNFCMNTCQKLHL